MRESLIVCGYAILVPVWVGVMIRVAVDAYRGEDYSVGYIGAGLILTGVVWGAVSKRFAKPAPVTEPTKLTVYDWGQIAEAAARITKLFKGKA